MRLRHLGWSALLLLLAPHLLIAETDETKVLCRPPSIAELDTEEILEVDARIGPGMPSKSTYKTRDRLLILVLDKNPFRYQYKLTVNEYPVKEEALTSFLGLPIFAGLVSPPGQIGAEERAAYEIALPPAEDRCRRKPFDREFELGQEIARQMSSLNSDIQVALNEAASKLNPQKEILDREKPALMSASVECAELVERAQNLRDAIDAGGVLPDLAVISSKSAALRGLATALEELVRSLRQKLRVLRENDEIAPSCFPLELDQALSQLDLTANGGVSKADDFDESHRKLKQLSELLEAAEAEISRILAQPDAFHTISWIGGYSRPTDVTVTLSRRDLATDGATFEAFRPISVNFGGGPRFVLAVGLSFANLEVVEYKRVQGLERDALGNLELDDAGNPNLTSVVGLGEDSDVRLTPLLILHGQLSQQGGWKGRIYLSLGLSVHSDNQGNDLEVLIGPSYDVIDGKFFITAGAYLGRVQELEGGLFLGAPVPEDMAELPVRKDREWAFAVALSYKIK